MKPFKFGFIIGRFNHIHVGHERMINFGLDVCEELLVLVGSSQEEGTERNPFNVLDRIDLIRQVYGDKVKVGYISDYTNENDICIEWGAHVLQTVDEWARVYGIKGKPDVTIFGNDGERASWYDPADIKYLAQLVIPRANINISATQLRWFLVQNRYEEWCTNVDKELRYKETFNKLRNTLLQIPFYKELVGHE